MRELPERVETSFLGPVDKVVHQHEQSRVVAFGVDGDLLPRHCSFPAPQVLADVDLLCEHIFDDLAHDAPPFYSLLENREDFGSQLIAPEVSDFAQFSVLSPLEKGGLELEVFRLFEHVP